MQGPVRARPGLSELASLWWTVRLVVSALLLEAASERAELGLGLRVTVDAELGYAERLAGHTSAAGIRQSHRRVDGPFVRSLLRTGFKTKH
jgi:hypothetical protein